MLYQNNGFKPNSGLLHRFKKRYGINLHSICGESKKVDEDVVMSWINRTLPNLVEKYSPDCIYNADETGLFWKMLPESTLDIKGNK
jgi:cellulase/cellobiase CelA1